MEKIKNICCDLGRAFTIGLLSGGGADDGAADAGAGDAAAVSGGVEFEIERARGDADEVIDPEQLNLF